MEYMLAKETVKKIEDEVNAFIEQGWRPLGGISVSDGWAYQAMIRDADTEDEYLDEIMQNHELSA